MSMQGEMARKKHIYKTYISLNFCDENLKYFKVILTHKFT